MKVRKSEQVRGRARGPALGSEFGSIWSWFVWSTGELLWFGSGVVRECRANGRRRKEEKSATMGTPYSVLSTQCSSR